MLHRPAPKRRAPLTAIRGCRCPSAVPSASADLRTSFPSVPPLSHEVTFPASHQTTIQRHGRCRRSCSAKLVADVGPRRTRGSTHHSCSPAIRAFAHSVACESLHSGLSLSIGRYNDISQRVRASDACGVSPGWRRRRRRDFPGARTWFLVVYAGALNGHGDTGVEVSGPFITYDHSLLGCSNYARCLNLLNPFSSRSGRYMKSLQST